MKVDLVLVVTFRYWHKFFEVIIGYNVLGCHGGWCIKVRTFKYTNTKIGSWDYGYAEGNGGV